ncbi:hypothetical protein [Pseudobacillus badius]|uniref:hypothetical protein n=1 Tax=Bacillus badius TaxID=1455 RepID=UPI0007B04D54|nr:hypothetical protein [Bacillus badius]KZO01117.1 hypothetical protein A4244_12675 [Bacillus badius]MED0667737.1 hypothetical protein [Bacillus badius]OCS89296.1 hypothetical protein A6M11_12690 [Bacillus badius]OVE51324.1 hypothetical protein B1A98_13180 [Bacillus badius]TDW02321.1 hypothetical protein B0G66_107154 [Bacillus badius]
MYLYHIVFEQDDDRYADPQIALNKGLSKNTAARFYSNGGRLFPELTTLTRPSNAEQWIDFSMAFGADFDPISKHYLKFPMVTKKVLVFNREISSDLFAYVEDEYMKGETGEEGYFTKGLPSKEDLMKQYWESMMVADEYLKRKPYKHPEILVFETIEKHFLEYI